jgi:hypothetical protein
MLLTEQELKNLIIHTENYSLYDLHENWSQILQDVLLEGKFSKKTNETLRKKAESSGISLSTLKAVYRRGLAAWATGHRQGTPQHAWAMGRVNSFISGDGGAGKADKDLWKGKSKKKKD